MRRAGGLATRGRGVRASGPKQGGGSGQRAWLQKQVVPAIERSGLEGGGRAEGGGAGSQLGCHVSPRLRTLTHWGEPVRLLPAPASKARRRPRGAAPPPRRIHRSCSFSAPRLPRPSESAAQVTDRTGVEGWLQSRHQRPPQWQLVLTKGFRFSLIEAAPAGTSREYSLQSWRLALHAARSHSQQLHSTATGTSLLLSLCLPPLPPPPPPPATKDQTGSPCISNH